jgi:hypothetical protein
VERNAEALGTLLTPDFQAKSGQMNIAGRISWTENKDQPPLKGGCPQNVTFAEMKERPFFS